MAKWFDLVRKELEAMMGLRFEGKQRGEVCTPG